jgi:hypothetical protein
MPEPAIDGKWLYGYCIVNQRPFWEEPGLRFMLYVIFAKDIFLFSNLLLAPRGILGGNLVDF